MRTIALAITALMCITVHAHSQNNTSIADLCPSSGSSSSGRLGLNELAASALAYSPTMALASSGVWVSTANVDEASARFYPNLQAQAAAGTIKQTFRTHNSSVVGRTSARQDDLPLGLRLTLNLYDAGYRRSNLARARSELESTTASVIEARRNLWLSIATAYFDALYYASALDLWRSIELSANSSYGIATKIHAAGVGTMSDLLLSANYLEQVRLSVKEFENLQEVSLIKLSEITGTMIPSAHILSMVCGNALSEFSGSDASEIVDAQPRVVAARLSIDAAGHAISTTRSLAGPSIDVSSGISLQRTIESGSSSVRRDGTVSDVKVTLTLLLSDGGATKAQIAASQGRLSGAEATLAQSKEDVRTQLRILAASYASERKRSAIAREAAETSVRGVEVAKGRYKSGVGSLLELLKAENDFATVQLQLRRTEANLQLLAVTVDVVRGRHD